MLVVFGILIFVFGFVLGGYVEISKTHKMIKKYDERYQENKKLLESLKRASLIIVFCSLSILNGFSNINSDTYISEQYNLSYSIENDTLWVDEIGIEGDGYEIIEYSYKIIENKKIGYLTGKRVDPFGDIDYINISFTIEKNGKDIFRIDGKNIIVELKTNLRNENQ